MLESGIKYQETFLHISGTTQLPVSLMWIDHWTSIYMYVFVRIDMHMDYTALKKELIPPPKKMAVDFVCFHKNLHKLNLLICLEVYEVYVSTVYFILKNNLLFD